MEQIPAGTPPPAHMPKQYKMVLNRVQVPCPYEEDEEGNCYKMVVIPHTPKLTTKRVEIPCLYETTTEGDCVQQVEVLCASKMKCSVRKKIQNALQAKGYEAGKGKAAFKTTTAKALAAFQKDNNLANVPWSIESLKELAIGF